MRQPDVLRIDSHKLIFHPHRVAQWLEGKPIAPIYLEISPAGSCNHRCTFCAVDFMEYRPRFLDAGILRERLTELGTMGVKSVMYAGEGEPLLHPDIAGIVQHTRSAGIDVAISTNGVLFVPELARQLLPCLSWIKFSVDAGSADTYAAVHRTAPEDFARVLDNIAASARLVAEQGWDCTIGVQALLLPDNAEEMELLAEQCRAAGARYLVIKPYSQHHKSHTCSYRDIDYTPYRDLPERLERFTDSRFSVICRSRTFARLQQPERQYDRCRALPFWSYVAASGDVWGCSCHLGDERFRYGNVMQRSFRDIWAGPERQRSLEFVAHELDPAECRLNCRMDAINRYLQELVHTPEHLNFI